MKTTKLFFLIILPVIFLLFFIGCDTKEEVQPKPPESIQVLDTSRTTGVNTALKSDPDLASLNVKGEVINFTATLTGTVKSQEQKDNAEQLAKTVPGIKTVINNIQIE